ncbi:hypothetical protein GCM10009550_71440 [Actinocorallia libanotica]|uniref:Uncharacterized protein n=1 Tax=Actinocorallia libanotica TaxID=46162 RepID=A0ABN1RXY8_9ACTN
MFGVQVVGVLADRFGLVVEDLDDGHARLPADDGAWAKATCVIRWHSRSVTVWWVMMEVLLSGPLRGLVGSEWRP